VERGAKAVICAEHRQHFRFAAAYAARGGHQMHRAPSQGAIAIGQVDPAMMEGATVVALRGNFDDALRIVREIGERSKISNRELDQPRSH